MHYIFFYSLPSGARKNRYLSPITYSHIIYHRVLLLNKVKVSRVGLQHVLPANDASHTSRTEGVFGLMYLMTSSVGAQSNDHKTTCTKNLYLSVKSGETVGSIRLQMSPQGPLISVGGQKIICLKVGWGCHFGSNGPIQIFNSMFLFTAFFV